MSENDSRKMTLVEEMRDALKAIGGPCEPCERQRWLERVAGKIGISFRSAKAIWYRERDYPHSRTIQKIKDAKKRRSNELQQILEPFAALEAAMREADYEFFGPAIEALKQAARNACSASIEHGDENSSDDE